VAVREPLDSYLIRLVSPHVIVAGQAISTNNNHVAQRSKNNPVVMVGSIFKASKIGMQLRLVYGEVVDQGVPDHFVQSLSGSTTQLRG
jgi:hypothetical protein